MIEAKFTNEKKIKIKEEVEYFKVNNPEIPFFWGDLWIKARTQTSQTEFRSCS